MNLHSSFAPFKLGTFSTDGRERFVGIVRDDTVIPLPALAPRLQDAGMNLVAIATMAAFFEHWDRNIALLQRVLPAVEGSVQGLPLDSLQVHAPFQPRQAFCTIANYRSGAVQAAQDAALKADSSTDAGALAQLAQGALQACEQRLRHGQPYVASKLPTTVTGPHDTIRLPRHVLCPDWEVELGVVIGKPARHVGVEDAMQYVAGYTIVNDITVRELVARAEPKGMGTDWLAAKNAPDFLPLGPYLIPAQCVPDPYALRMTLRLNGERMQDESCSDMIFNIAEQIAYISQQVQLLPGDLICTGSPAGFGLHYGRFLQAGDVLEAAITGFGSQRNRCVPDAL